MNGDKVYKKLVEEVLQEGNWRDTRSGNCLSTFGKFIEFDLRDGFPLLTTKFVSPRAIIGELLWFINGEHTISDLKYRTFGDENSERNTIWCPDFKRWTNTDEYRDLQYYGVAVDTLGSIYGVQWFEQLREVVERINSNPFDRRLIVDSWDFEALHEMALPPCHYAYQFYVDGDYIDLMWHQRSVDVFLGLPFNIASYSLLLHIVCRLTGKTPRLLKASLGDVHLYDNSIEAVKEQVSRSSKDSFYLAEDLGFDEFNWEAIEELTADDLLHLFKDYQHHPSIKVEVCVGS